MGTVSSRSCFEYAFRILGSSKIERVDSVLRAFTTSNTNLHLNFAEPFPLLSRLPNIKFTFEPTTSYYHPGCQTETEINDHVIVIAALDPWYFPLHSTDCVGCGSAPMKDVVLEDGQSVYDAFASMRKTVPAAGKMVRFLGIPLMFAIVGACLSPFFPTKNPQNANHLQIAIACALFGAFVGCFAIRYIFKELRRIGLFWKT